MHSIPESKKSHLWRKVVWHTDPDQYPLGPHHSAEVYCCEEANGYSVWYVRKLARDGMRSASGVENGDYLLNFFPRNRRDDAIERAVLIAHSDPSVDKVIEYLDTLATASQKV
jgi:hypothetical protein